MDSLQKYWAQQEKEERDKKRRRKFYELLDEHWERVRCSGGFSPWSCLVIALLAAVAFVFFAFGFFFRALPQQPAQSGAAKPAAAPPQPSQNARRVKAPATKERK